MDISQTLFFTGHRNIYRPEGCDAFALLSAAISSFIEKGYRYFIAGGAVGFDTMAAECVLKLRDEGAPIQLILMLPCKNQAKKWSVWEQKKYNNILKRADRVSYISEEYTRECMFMRNRAMADASSACIAYCNSQRGGTAYTVNYAVKKGITVTNIALAF